VALKRFGIEEKDKGAWSSSGALFASELSVLEGAIWTHTCLQSIQQWVAEFMVMLKGAIGTHACWVDWTHNMLVV
jgi:hypothetical protein